MSLECFDRAESEPLLARLADCAARRVVLTGCGAEQLAPRIRGAERVEEFEAWARGARLRLEGLAGSFLLVSIGTGTSALLVDPERVRRVGGTSLGGGTLIGLSTLLLGTRDFDRIAQLAARGDRSRVDLTIGDIYSDGFELPAAFTAASLAKLQPGATPDPADLAQGLMGLLGENVGRTCALLAAEQGVERVVFGGSCLRGNDYLANLLRGMCMAGGLEALVLEDGEYTGAVGALQVAEADGAREVAW